jgi:hypothetical protein
VADAPRSFDYLRRNRPPRDGFPRLSGSPLDATGVARAILAIAAGDEHREATLLSVTSEGLEVIPR